MHKIINSIDAPKAIGAYSQAIKTGNLLFVSGQICINQHTNKLENDSIESEIHQVMKNLAFILEEAQTNFSNVVKTSIFLTNMADFSIIDEIYGSYFKNLYFPARETIEVKGLPKNCRIEISMVVNLGV
ncbi:MAG: Rid family detoxifying hydrolase [Solirubrobacteraceae bacterium]